MAKRIALVSGGLRVSSSTRLLADQAAEAVRNAFADRNEQVEFVHVELRDYAHDLMDALLTGFPAGRLRDQVEAVVASDGVIAVTPTYSASYSGLFKAFFDIVEEGQLAGVPLLMAATGGSERHSLMLEFAMRPLFAYLGAETVRTGVFAATSDFGESGLDRRLARAASELVDAVIGSGSRNRVDEFEQVTSLEEMLRRSRPG